MTDRAVALLALVVAFVALVGIIVHALIPTPPAHVADPFGLRSSSSSAAA